LQETLWKHASELLDLQRATEWLAAVEMTHPASVAALARAGMGAAEVQQMGAALLTEGVPLRERVSLVEAMARNEAAGVDGIGPLLEAVRPALARTITEQVAVDGVVEVIGLSAQLERELLTQIERTGLAVPPEQAEQWAQTLLWLAERFSRPQRPAVILCHPRTRALVARQISDCGARLRAITAAELLPLTQLRCKQCVKSLQAEPMMSAQVREA
jgi:flagellar biosynthesis component FlhA